VLLIVIRLSVAVVVVLLIASQCRKPRWGIGRLIVRLMNRSHSSLTDWGLGHVQIECDFSILDVGCGGGRTIQKLAAIASGGRVCGVDHSAASVTAARRTNADVIAAGRVEILEGTVSALPFPEASFDLATAVETHYYWPNLTADLREVGRVLKPGGVVVIVAEAYRRSGAASALVAPLMRLIGARHLTVDEHRAALVAAGLTDVVIEEERRKGWICARGRRVTDAAPATPSGARPRRTTAS
jgi:SAM-dependent methyltransferase